MIYPADTGFRISDNPHSISLANDITTAPTMGNEQLVGQMKEFIASGLQGGGMGKMIAYPTARGVRPTDEYRAAGWAGSPFNGPRSIFGGGPLSSEPLAWAGSQYQEPLALSNPGAIIPALPEPLHWSGSAFQSPTGFSGLSGDTNDTAALLILAGLGVFTLYSFRKWPFR